MANGQIKTFDVYAAVILWDGQPIRIMAEEAATEPLIGMSLLYGYKMTMEMVDGDPITLERI